MFGRIFGRGKDDPDQAVCAECGRTLLAGEWTQTIVDADGREKLICSLCGQTRAPSDDQPLRTAPTPANGGRVRESRTEARDARSESDAFWRAIKEKEAEIERLQAQLARAEAEKQELAGRFAHLDTREGSAAVSGAAFGAPPDAVPYNQTGDSSEPGERTWGETPAEFAAELGALRRRETSPATAEPAPGEAGEGVTATPVADVPAVVFEDTQPLPALGDEAVAAASSAPAEPMGQPPGGPGETLTPESRPPATLPEQTAAAAAGVGADVTTPAAEPTFETAPTAAELEAEAAALTLLQRGVDLLNVSRVPRKIAETNEQLGLPSVHVGFDDQTVVVTFMWTMGWYRFHVDLQGGDVRMVDRGYVELSELRPNAAVRGDGTVQLAPAQISRAAMQQRPAEKPPEPQTQAADQAPAQPESPRAVAQKPPEILSKSLLGQRSDDEAATWEQTQARDFDWDR